MLSILFTTLTTRVPISPPPLPLDPFSISPLPWHPLFLVLRAASESCMHWPLSIFLLCYSTLYIYVRSLGICLFFSFWLTSLYMIPSSLFWFLATPYSALVVTLESMPRGCSWQCFGDWTWGSYIQSIHTGQLVKLSPCPLVS